MQASGDVVEVELGLPQGHEAEFVRPAVIVTAQRILDAGASVLQVVPLTSTFRGFHSELVIEPDRHNGLPERSGAQCQHIRAVSADRLRATKGNVGPAVLSQVREMVGLLLDL